LLYPSPDFISFCVIPALFSSPAIPPYAKYWNCAHSEFFPWLVWMLYVTRYYRVTTCRYNEIHILMVPCITKHFTTQVGTMSISNIQMRTNCRLKIAYCYGLQMWIFGQTPWTDVDQNLTIHIPLLTRHDTGVGMVPASPCPVLPATHEALPRHCCRCHRQLEQGRCWLGI